MNENQLHKNNNQSTYNLNSVWINANAGSGKTTTLIKRILYFLMRGVKIQEILIVTYTTNGVNELKDRLEKEILNLVRLTEEELSSKIESIVGHSTKELCYIAKNLYKEIICEDTEILVTTIHSFCYKIIQNIANQQNKKSFEILQEGSVKLKAERFTRKMVWEFIEDQIQVQKDNNTLEFLSVCNSKNINDIIRTAIEDSTISINTKNNFFACKSEKEKTDNHSPPSLNITENKVEMLDQQNSDYDSEDIDSAKIFAKNSFIDITTENASSPLLSFLNVFEGGKYQSLKTIQKIITNIRIWQNSHTVNSNNNSVNYHKEIKALFDILHSKKDKEITPKSLRIKKIEPHEERIYLNLCMNIREILEQYNSIILKQINTVVTQILTIAKSSYNIYLESQNKISNNSLQETIIDMILEGSIDVRTNPVISNINHIFVDEAQDVSPTAWNIILSLFNHLIEKKNATFSIVGDEKQSIFSFQGANIKHFYNIKNNLIERLKENNKVIELQSLRYSYRTGQTLLDEIDKIFNNEKLIKSISQEEEIHHISKVDNKSQEIKIVYNTENIEDKVDKVKSDFWDLAYDKYCNNTNIDSSVNPEETEYNFQIREIINIIIQLKEEGCNLEDIIILVRNREAKNNAILKLAQQLNNHKIECNLDKFLIFHHIVFQDVLTVIKFLDNPNDNATLIKLLRSVFFRFSIEDISKISLLPREVDSKKISLISIIQKEYPEIFYILKILLETFQKKGIASALLMLMHKFDGQKYVLKYYKNNGLKIVNKIITFTLEEKFSAANTIDLIDILSNARISLESSNKDGVKISTIHSAKGSEAKNVILWDLASKTRTIRGNSFIKTKDGQYMYFISSQVLNKEIMNIVEDAEEELNAEEIRLLYVALTRAKNNMFIIGNYSENQNWLSKIKILLQ